MPAKISAALAAPEAPFDPAEDYWIYEEHDFADIEDRLVKTIDNLLEFTKRAGAYRIWFHQQVDELIRQRKAAARKSPRRKSRTIPSKPS